jgi:hypothetical protein
MNVQILLLSALYSHKIMRILPRSIYAVKDSPSSIAPRKTPESGVA